MTSLLSYLAGLFASAVGQSAVRFTAWKAVIWVLAISIFPILLNNFLYEIINGVLSLQANGGNTQAYSQVLELTGLAGWIAAKMRIPEGISIIMSAVMFTFISSYFRYFGSLYRFYIYK